MSISPTTFELTFEQRPGYLYALVRAEEISYRGALDYVRLVADRCRMIGADSLLLERRIPMLLSDVEMFFIKNYFIEILTCRRAAFVNPLIDVRRDLPAAIFTGCEHGTQYKHFSCPLEAGTWLMKQVVTA